MALGIYFHLPFCVGRCRYCAFYSGESLDQRLPLVRTLATEMELRRQEARGPVTSVYFGGGTPSLLDPAHMVALLEGVARHWGLDPEAEVTLEINPGDAALLGPFRAAGITRLSVGVQTLDDVLLAELGRRHTAKQALRVVAAAATRGFRSVSADLLFGLPEQTPQQLIHSVGKLADAGAQHLSLYSLELHPGTSLASAVAEGDRPPVSPDKELAQAEALALAAARLGFAAYEVSNFCRPGHQCRHNLAYWDGTPFLGLGPGAHSYLPARGPWGTRCWNDTDLEAYLGAMESNNRPPGDAEELTREQSLLERLFLYFRRPVKLVPTGLAERFALDPESAEKMFRELADQALLRRENDGGLVPSWEGMRRADGLALTTQERLLGGLGPP